MYRVEPAKSSRSNCQAKGSAKCCLDERIEQGALRVGWFNSESGTYGGVGAQGANLRLARQRGAATADAASPPPARTVGAPQVLARAQPRLARAARPHSVHRRDKVCGRVAQHVGGAAQRDP